MFLIRKCIRKRFLITLLLFFCPFIFLTLTISKYYSEPQSFEANLSLSDYELELDSTAGVSTDNNDDNVACPIPKLKPFSKAVRAYLKKIEHQHQPVRQCQDIFPVLFNSTVEGYLVPAKGPEELERLGVKECCYRQILRVEHNDEEYRVAPECYPISMVAPTKIEPSHEFIGISCKIRNILLQLQCSLNAHGFIDMHAFFPHVKPEMEDTKSKSETSANSGKKRVVNVNVLIFGIDSVSRMNFLRTLPKTYKFLQKLDVIDMAGYNKVAENTFPNLAPLLTSKTSWELTMSRACAENDTFDKCPLIWKEFAKLGYRTSYAEDQHHIAVFNFKHSGFINPPTYYYLRPFTIAATASISYQRLKNAHVCYGPRLGFHFLLEYMKKFAFRMEQLKKPYFQFIWSTSISHGSLKNMQLGDEHLLKTLIWLEKGGYLNKTVLVLMSDHGQRVEAFRNTIQGQLEDRLPFMMLLLPKWMKTGSYSGAFQNMRGNRNRLVTTFDLHETLKDLLNLERIEAEQIGQRANELAKLKEVMPRGISLFLPIPAGRTCAKAEIDESYCSCTYFKRIPTEDKEAKMAAVTAIQHIYESK